MSGKQTAASQGPHAPVAPGEMERATATFDAWATVTSTFKKDGIVYLNSGPLKLSHSGFLYLMNISNNSTNVPLVIIC